MFTIRRRLTSVGVLLSAALLFAPAALPPQSGAVDQTLAEDSFDRTISSGLGNAPTGGAWTIYSGSSLVKVAGGQASFDGTANRALDARLDQAQAVDVDLTATVNLPKMDTSNSAMVALIGRSTTDGRAYRLWLNLNDHGKGNGSLHLDRSSPGNDTDIGSSVAVPGLARANQRIKLRMKISGSEPVAVSGSAWLDGKPEPAAQLQAQDLSANRLTDRGSIGLATVSGPTTTPVNIEHFIARSATPTQGPRGSLPVGEARYPVPANAVFVSPSGNDANPGTEAAPKYSVKAAVKATPTGGTIVLRGGTYHEEGIEIFRAMTVQNYPGEAVWFDGSSVVTRWTPSNNRWKTNLLREWDHILAFDRGGSDTEDKDHFLDPRYPLAAWPDQVFVDGVQLEQVSPKSNIGAGQFAVDYESKELMIGQDPSGHEVRVSDQNQLFTVGAPDVTLRGFGMRRFANSLPTQGIVYMARQHNLITNVVIEDVATTGITMFSDNGTGGGTIDHVTIRRSGLTGIGAMNFDGGKILNSVITDGNTQKFNPWPATAGTKICKSKNVTFENNLVLNSYNSNGFWADESVIGVTAVHNVVINEAQDGFAGVQVELSTNAIVADNVISGQDRGIYLFDSNRLRIVNNTVSNSRVADISVDQDFRRQADPNIPGHDIRNPIPDPLNPWIASDVEIRNNLFGTDSKFSNFQLWAVDKDKAITANQMVSQVTGNAFESKDATSPTLIGWGINLDGSASQFNDLGKWTSTIGRGGWRNITYPAGTSVVQAQKMVDHSSVPSGLDSDIAALIGQAAGAKRIGAFQPAS